MSEDKIRGNAPDGVAPTPSLVEENKRLREALKKYGDELCEGWCADGGEGSFDDCNGCPARAALRNGEPG